MGANETWKQIQKEFEQMDIEVRGIIANRDKELEKRKAELEKKYSQKEEELEKEYTEKMKELKSEITPIQVDGNEVIKTNLQITYIGDELKYDINLYPGHEGSNCSQKDLIKFFSENFGNRDNTIGEDIISFYGNKKNIGKKLRFVFVPETKLEKKVTE